MGGTPGEPLGLGSPPQSILCFTNIVFKASLQTGWPSFQRGFAAKAFFQLSVSDQPSSAFPVNVFSNFLFPTAVPQGACVSPASCRQQSLSIRFCCECVFPTFCLRQANLRFSSESVFPTFCPRLPLSRELWFLHFLVASNPFRSGFAAKAFFQLSVPDRFRQWSACFPVSCRRQSFSTRFSGELVFLTFCVADFSLPDARYR